MEPRMSAVASIDRDDWERDRLAALQRFDILDSPREEPFDRITRLIRSIFGVSTGIVSMIDGHRQWYKSADGSDRSEVPVQDTFCRFPLASGESLVVPDAKADMRFADNPNVTSGGVGFYAGVPLRTTDGHVIGTVCAIDPQPRDFSARELKILEDLALITMNELDLRQRATVDVLTGALSRRAFKEEGARAVALASRHHHALACLVLDLDHFKSVNDGFGHAAGDKVLADVIKSCVALLRQSDLIGRLGGEEFAVLLPLTDRTQAIEVAEKLRQAIADLVFNFDGQNLPVTCSFGVAVLDGATPDIESLLERADAALYAAKQAGRNRVVAAEPAPEAIRTNARRVLKAGRIIFNNRASLVNCTVRWMSDEGAGMDVTGSFGIPSRFTLAIRSDGFECPCEVVASTDRHIEVRFT
ncbi:sensor domain-containing diguanylate cyclase [Devosia oryziradicis]|uniref:diguanylate cyclase n=2 Tax=Devosia oryziradicis TaxID=2801335 RepID=A0ABX7C4L0_9HYPH|nr:sensor domain-containing diguanylate cyclase [Devosia oryziradicis]